MRKSALAASIALSATLVLGACGSGSGGSAPDTTAAPSAAAFNDDDVMFAQMMIPHHEQAIEMSDIALDPTVGASDAVRQLATRIKGAQDPEIELMTGMLTGWGKGTEMDPSMDHSSMMDGMLSADELDALGALRGAEFDRAWMGAMIEHHEGALSMAKDVLEGGSDPAVRRLAEEIVSGQQAEIEEMRGLLG
ncbi:MAG: DUF305 domain-containing protein [Actinomycetota bacterium]